MFEAHLVPAHFFTDFTGHLINKLKLITRLLIRLSYRCIIRSKTHPVEPDCSRDMEDFWRKSLEGCEAAPFPSLPSSIDIPRATAKVEYQFSDTRFLDSSYDVSVLIGAAW